MMLAPETPENIVEEIFGLYEKHGSQDYIGEPVSQIEHMSQAAALAAQEGYDDEVILAAFFHDLGHLCAAGPETLSMNGLGNINHEQLGAKFLRERGFSHRVAKLVESHVIAKRYLTYKYPEYYEKLSPASKGTLEFQGGVMSADEARAFEADPDKDLIIRMRYWDDEAKQTNVPVNNIQQLKNIALLHLKNQVSQLRLIK